MCKNKNTVKPYHWRLFNDKNALSSVMWEIMIQNPTFYLIKCVQMWTHTLYTQMEKRWEILNNKVCYFMCYYFPKKFLNEHIILNPEKKCDFMKKKKRLISLFYPST